MLYWKDDVDLECCKFCGDARYKPTRGQDPRWKKSTDAVLRYLLLTPPLQRLYSSRATAEHMMWHATHQTEEGSMCHPSYAKAWKHFDKRYPDFAEEPRNVGLGLCTEGFALHSQYGRTYSCWHVIITPYNLSPGMCMSSEYIFFMMVIPGLSNPKRLIDVYLESLIEEMLHLWHVDVDCERQESPEFRAQSAKNKVNQATNSKAAATVYRGGSSSVGTHKRKMETQLGRPVNPMKVFEKMYKKKEDSQWSCPRVEEVAISIIF
ncbi:UNVERIFIED_CONTAM: hypothetical protein Slati_4449200 [Sesamum latifolium]|uniref:Transposase n=1 Tax=Sesamum latifolium TaxID=2727402 RepID=A0AAW2SRS1_9LAMI